MTKKPAIDFQKFQTLYLLKSHLVLMVKDIAEDNQSNQVIDG